MSWSGKDSWQAFIGKADFVGRDQLMDARRQTKLLRILRRLSLMLAGVCLAFSAASDAATSLEPVRIATPGKLIDFAALYTGAHLGIYRQEGIDPQFIVMKSGIIMQALTAGEIDYTTLLASSVRAAIAGLPVRVIMG